MTREEAIEMCQSLKFVIFITDDEDYTDMIEEALDMAIEALREDAELDELFEDAESIEDEWGTSVGR